MKKRLLASFLAAVMALQVSGLTALAEQPVLEQASADTENITEQNTAEQSGGSVFNFSAAKYVMSETDKSYEVKVERKGNADTSSDVVFKAVDALAVYGEDYTVLDEDGNALEKQEGTVIPLEELTQLASAQDEETTEDFSDEPKNDIFEARNALLGIDAENSEEQEQVKDEITTAVETLNKDLFDAEGVSGVLHFAEGETEKIITVAPIDNDKGEADKTAVMALLGASDGSIAPNATASLVIMDDEEYVPPVFEMAQSNLTLDAQNSTAELTVKRVSGEDYYTTVYVSTYSMTAKSGEDFTAVENEQVVFAPGETEKTIRVEALAFEQSGDFGVRIKSDGSCEIGENDRTVVHIKGEKSVSESVPEQVDEVENSVALQSADDSSASVEVFAAEDGVVGEPDFVVPKEDKHIGRMVETRYGSIDNFIGVGDVAHFNTGYDGSAYFNIDLTCGSWNGYPSAKSVTVKFQLKIYPSGYFSRDNFQMMAYSGKYDSNKGRYGSSDFQKVPIKKYTDTYELKINSSSPTRDFTIVFPKNTSGSLTLEEVKLHYTSPYTFSVPDCKPITTVSMIDLDSDNDKPVNQTVDYTPPKLTTMTEDGTEVKKIYPGNGVVILKADEENLMKHGFRLKASNYEAFDNGKRIDAMTLYKASGSVRPYAAVSSDVNVHLQTADNGDTYINVKNKKYKEPFNVKTGTLLKATGYAAAGKVITGYDIYAAKVNSKGEISEKRFLYTYKNPYDSSKLGGTKEEERFFVPAIQEDGWTEVLIVPQTVVQNLTVKPHPSTKNETIYEDEYDDNGNVTGQHEVTYDGRAYIQQAFEENVKDEDTHFADKNGQIFFDKINSGTSYTFRSVVPLGYITEWINGTGDDDEDGDSYGDETQDEADKLYTTVYGNQFVYKVSQVQPKYYYRFTKFPPSRLMNGKTREGRVLKDKRTIREYNGRKAADSDYVPCSGATVQIGENTAVTDSAGRYEIKMDGVPDNGRVSTVVTSDGSPFVTHVLTQRVNPIRIPCYDTFEPQKVTAAYKNEAAVSVPGIKVADKELTVTVKVRHSANSLYIKKAGFYITDSKGDKVIDCTDLAEQENSGYKINYTHDSTFGYAELKMNPSKDMLSGYKIYVYFIDQNGTEHTAMDTGHKFIEMLNLGTIFIGDIGSSSADGATTEKVDLLGAPLFDMSLGEISGFTTSTGLIEPDTQLLDASGNKMYQYDATLYSYRWNPSGYQSWTDSGKAKSREVSLYAENGVGDNGENGGNNGNNGNSGNGGNNGNHENNVSSGNSGNNGNGLLENGVYINQLKNGSDSGMENGLPKESDKNQPPKNGTPPKGASVNNNKSSVTATSKYNFNLAPSIRFDLVTTARPAGKDKNGNDIYKHYFEEMSLGVGLNFSVNSKTEISFPIGISVMIKPSLSGSVEAVYYMKTDYGDDKYWERPIEYSADSFGFFKDYDGKMYRAGFIELNPKITLDVGVKVAIVEVDVGATFDFDMDFKFDSNGKTRTYGNMKYDVHINLIILSFKVYSKNIVGGNVHLFGENEPLDSGVTLMSAAVSNAFEGGDITVKPLERDYLDDRSEWKGDKTESKPFLAKLFASDEPLDEENPADALLQKGVMTGDDMASAMLDTDVMFTAYVDDNPKRGDNDRGCLYYTYTNADGSWTEPKAIEDDGTLDKDPVVYDMGDKLFVTWLTANDKFDGKENSIETIRQQLNSLNIHGAFFDKESKTFGEVFEVTKNTQDDLAAEGNIAVTGIADNGIRVYYTKTQYSENPESVNELIVTSSVIAYRDYKDGEWSNEYTAEEKQKLTDSGENVDEYTTQWYGQRFEDTRINEKWPLVTDLEADIAPDGTWDYFAFIADEDGNYETSADRKIYFNFDTYDAPVCVTPYAGAYDDLQFVYSGNELIMTFKSSRETDGENDETESVGGISYINLSEVFEKTNYEAVKQADGTYQMALEDAENEDGEKLYYSPEWAVTMDGVVQKYQVFSDLGGRIYLMWTDNTVNDDGTNSIQIYTSVYNGNTDWMEGVDSESGYYGSTWSYPVMMTSPLSGSYDGFTAQSIIGSEIAFVAKRTNPDDETELVFHLRVPDAAFTFNEDLLSEKYAYIDEPVIINAEITNVGLKAHKAINAEDSENKTWVSQPGKYQIKIERLVDGETVETLSENEVDTIWDVGDTIYAQYEWTPTELPDNMGLRVSVTDIETGEEICSETVPIVKAAEIDLRQLETVSEEKNEATVSFDVVNMGNIPADLTAVISAVTGENEKQEKTEISRTEIGSLGATESKPQEICVPIEEKYQTIDEESGSGNFRLQIDILNGDENVYSVAASGAVVYDTEAIEDVKEIESLSVTETSVKLKKGGKAQVNAALSPASAAEDNKVIYVSSDESVAKVNKGGEITAVGKGSVTVTAYAVSKMEISDVQPDGSTQLLNVKDFIPDNMIKSKQIAVNVSGGSGSGSGSSSSKATPTPTPTPTDNPTVTPEPSDNNPAQDNWFIDVGENAWYYNSVKYMFENGLMVGVSDTEFAPEADITRAMFVTTLYRMENEPDISDEILGYPFADVDAESWYGNAVYWARLNGIVEGYSDEKFAPEENITREQMAAIVYRYAKFKEYDTELNGELSYSDNDSISDYAKDAVIWSSEHGIMLGNEDNTFSPMQNTTRAQAAAVFERIIKNVKDIH